MTKVELFQWYLTIANSTRHNENNTKVIDWRYWEIGFAFRTLSFVIFIEEVYNGYNLKAQTKDGFLKVISITGFFPKSLGPP